MLPSNCYLRGAIFFQNNKIDEVVALNFAMKLSNFMKDVIIGKANKFLKKLFEKDTKIRKNRILLFI